MYIKIVFILFIFGICFSPLSSLTTSHADYIASMKEEPNGGCGGGGGGGAGCRKGGQPPKGSHRENIRPSSRERHENADARRQREQKKG